MALGRMRQPQAVQTKDVTDYQADALNIQSMRQLGQRSELDLMQEELAIDDSLRAKEDEQYAAELYEKHDGNMEAIFGPLFKQNPTMALALRESENQNRISLGQQVSQGLQNENEQRTQAAQIFEQQDFEQEGAWPQAHEQLVQVDPELAEGMPEEYDQEWVDNVLNTWMTDKEKNEIDLAGLKEMMGDDLYRGYARILANATNAEEYNEKMELARGILPSRFRAKIMGQFWDEYPGDEKMQVIRDAAKTPQDVHASRELAALEAHRSEQLAETAKYHRELERRAGAGDQGAQLQLFKVGSEKRALMDMGIRDLGIQFPQGEKDPRFIAARRALFERVLAMKTGTSGGDDGLDAAAVRAAQASMAEWYRAEPMPDSETEPEAFAEWEKDRDAAQRAAEVQAGIRGLGDIGAPPPEVDLQFPYSGDRSSMYTSANSQEQDRARGIAKRAMEESGVPEEKIKEILNDEAAMNKFLRNNPEAAKEALAEGTTLNSGGGAVSDKGRVVNPGYQRSRGASIGSMGGIGAGVEGERRGR